MRSAARAQIIRRPSIEAIRRANWVVAGAPPIEVVLGMMVLFSSLAQRIAACVGAEENPARTKIPPARILVDSVRVTDIRASPLTTDIRRRISFNGKICRMTEVPYIRLRPLLSANRLIRSMPPGMEC